MMDHSLTFDFPAKLTPAEFLASYWQQRPLLCTGALRSGIAWPNDEEILEVAIQDTCDARLIAMEKGRHRVEQGPFAVDRFDDLPTPPWTLLIQSMEVWHPDLHKLQQALDFLPRWRFDDIMISLSSANGGVGAHVDQYDVFLIQAAGRRRWSWGGSVHRADEESDLRQVSKFEPTDHAELGPGDVLYLPPGVPHDGVALDDGAITVSIGFRAPGLTDLIGHMADSLAEKWEDAVESEPRLGDAGRKPAGDPWMVEKGDLAAMMSLLRDALDDEELAARALGEQISIPRFPPEPPEAVPEPEDLAKLLRSGWTLERWAGSRIFHHPLDEERALLFVDGFALPVPPQFGAWVARQEQMTSSDWLAWHRDPDALLAIMMMVGRGTFGLVPASKEPA